MTDRFERAVSFMLGIAAVAIAAAVVHREFVPAPMVAQAGLNPLAPPKFVDNWSDVSKAAIPLGSSTAPVSIVEFGDFQCPACRAYEPKLQAIQAKYGSSVAISYVHWPLEPHRHALKAAQASECASEQGRFTEMHDALFRAQDSLGTKLWSSYANDARIADLREFGRCMTETASWPRIDAGISLATKMRLHGTPTIIVNGWQFVGGPADSTMTDAIDRLLAGKEPRGASR
jgi:protein-disulfide isomerase